MRVKVKSKTLPFPLLSLDQTGCHSWIVLCRPDASRLRGRERAAASAKAVRRGVPGAVGVVVGVVVGQLNEHAARGVDEKEGVLIAVGCLQHGCIANKAELFQDGLLEVLEAIDALALEELAELVIYELRVFADFLANGVTCVRFGVFVVVVGQRCVAA